MTDNERAIMREMLPLLETIITDCESGTAPLDDTWWMNHTEKTGIHETIYERALTIRKLMYAEGIA